MNHGPHGDILFRGKYVDELTAAINEAALYMRATAGVLQSELAEPPAVHFWSPERMARLDREVPFPSILPEVPVPDNAVTLRTGEPLPCFGIYEPLVEDGCMNYLLEGAPAPQAVNRGAIIRPAVWRLIWEDKRYLDGSIPEDEDRYFRPTEAPKPAPCIHVDADPVISLNSGQRVAKPGTWVVTHRLDVRQRFELGDALPQHEGRDVVWLWVSKD